MSRVTWGCDLERGERCHPPGSGLDSQSTPDTRRPPPQRPAVPVLRADPEGESAARAVPVLRADPEGESAARAVPICTFRADPVGESAARAVRLQKFS